MSRFEFNVAAAVIGWYTVLMCGLFAIALVRGIVWRHRARTSASLRPKIREALVDYLAGSNDTTRLRAFIRQNRRNVADGLLEFRATVAGETRDRLCTLALDLGLVHEWVEDAGSRDVVRRRLAFTRLSFVCSYEPCRRVAGDLLLRGLEDRDQEVLMAASRALVQSGDFVDVEHVFGFALSGNLYIRILLAEDLRRYAMEFCGSAIPGILRSGDLQRILPALEILVAWERALPLPHLADLMDHPDHQIRIQALRLAPLVPVEAPERAAILSALDDADPGISSVAASTAHRIQLVDALPALARGLRRGPSSLARAAAAAMAGMPPQGWTALEELSGAESAGIAGIARDALELARKQEV
jgi:HEAT repeat protein